MAGVVSFDTKEWEDLIREIDKNVKDPRPMLKTAFSIRGFKDIMDHFENEKSPEGTWIKSQRAIKEGGKTLQDTGKLRGGFLPSNIKNKDKNSVVFFNPVPYGGIHDEGTNKIPQREFMWLSDNAMDDMAKIILDLVIK